MAKKTAKRFVLVDINKTCPYTLDYEYVIAHMNFRGGRKMVSKTVVFCCDDALQMKAVAVLIQKASAFRSSIYLTRNGRRANAKSLLGLMSLGIESNAEIEIAAEGADQQEALDALVTYLENPKV